VAEAETELAKKLEIAEADAKIAEAKARAAEANAKTTAAADPWWRSGLTVTTLTAIVAAVVPVTAGVQSCVQSRAELALKKEEQSTAQALKREEQGTLLTLKKEEQSFQIRDHYLTSFTKDPRYQQQTLEFIIATTDDGPVKAWAESQLVQVKQKVGILDDRKRLYVETIGIVGRLADRGTPTDRWEADVARFWHLYRDDLLSVESPEVEGLMVRIGRVLGQCRQAGCTGLQDLAYQLARQMKGEIRAMGDAWGGVDMGQPSRP
jgi:hypothetical protein